MSTSLCSIYYLLSFATFSLGFIRIEKLRCNQRKFLNSSSFVHFPPDNNRDLFLFEQWGVQRSNTVREFPKTIDDVINHASEAIIGEIYGRCPLSQSIASNAMSRSLFTDRPVRKRCDSGRIGIELSGLRSLFPSDLPMSHSQAMRITGLKLCGKLSMNSSWERFETVGNQHGDPLRGRSTRPVAVFFNTRSEALMASCMLQKLKLCDDKYEYEDVRIHCLSDSIPNDLRVDTKRRHLLGGLSRGTIDARRGICISVQPTDFNAEPVVDAIENFQKLAARAAVEQLPLIAISPRFLNSNYADELRRDQSVYQQSAVYGGIEPPKGPTPWIMRDFTPPVFCWVGDAIAICKPPRVDCKLTRIAMWQSAMEEEHKWHSYACRECREEGKILTDFFYLASTRSSSGRPTKHLLMKLLEEFTPMC